MEELHNHSLVFNEDTSTSPCNTTYDCERCRKVVQGPSYSCGECRYFHLHKRCAEAPLEIQHHPAHRDHPLRLLCLPTSDDPENCSFCWDELKRFVYCCYRCEFYLHFACALLPCATDGNFIETSFAAHTHPLVSISPIGNVTCHGCTDPIQDDASCESFACFDCGGLYHKKCLEQPSTINHPCHRRHQLLLVRNKPEDHPECNLCQSSIRWGFFYRCVPCKFYIHLRCAWPPPIIDDKAHHDHPFTLLLKPNDPFDCNACGNRGNHVSYICSTCNIQVHKDCISLPRHIRLNLHPLPISRCFSICTDHNDSGDWDCKICYKKVNIDHGSYYCSRRYCSRSDCDFVIHVKCSTQHQRLYDVVEVENPDEFEESDLLSDESTSSIIRVIKEIKVGDDVIAAEIEHVSHEHNLIFSDEIKDNKYCNGCVLPILSSFYYCSQQCDFFLHKACAELRRIRRLWFSAKPFNLLTNDFFYCTRCHYRSTGFSYKVDGVWNDNRSCLRCASISHSFTYQADEPHYIFFVDKYEGKCNSCRKNFSLFDAAYRCKDCTFALHLRCVSLPRTAWHKCDQHSLTFAYRDPDNYPLRHYCDICEEQRDPEPWFYHCETCDKAVHIKCVLGEYSFINAGTKYRDQNHPHPLTFVKKMYYYPECVLCHKPCQDVALECVGHGCDYIVHWTCIKPPYF